MKIVWLVEQQWLPFVAIEPPRLLLCSIKEETYLQWLLTTGLCEEAERIRTCESCVILYTLAHSKCNKKRTHHFVFVTICINTKLLQLRIDFGKISLIGGMSTVLIVLFLERAACGFPPRRFAIGLLRLCRSVIPRWMMASSTSTVRLLCWAWSSSGSLSGLGA